MTKDNLLYIYNITLDMSNKTHLYNRIKLYRIAAGLSREDLAAKIEVNFQTIGYLEREEYNPSLELALKITAVFGVTIEQLFSFEPFPTKF